MENGQLKLVFLGRQTMNCNHRLPFQHIFAHLCVLRTVKMSRSAYRVAADVCMYWICSHNKVLFLLSRCAYRVVLCYLAATVWQVRIILAVLYLKITLVFFIYL
jgi:hypothetical protein